MKMNPRACFCVVGLFAAALLGLWRFDSAFGQQGGRGGSGGGGGFAAGVLGTGSVAANAEFVYVLQSNTLIQLAAKDLTEVKRVTLQPARDAAGGRTVLGGQGGAGGAGGGFGGGQGGAGGGQPGAGGRGGAGGQGGAGGGFRGAQGGAGGAGGGQPGAGGQGGAGGGFGGGQGGAGGAFGGLGSSGSVAANADYVYVLQDHTLTQLAANDLTQIKQLSITLGPGASATNDKADSKRGR